MNTLARLPENGPANLLFLLFHGHAQDESSMQPMAQALAAKYPQAAVLSVRSPNPGDVLPGRSRPVGYQFFSRLGVDDDNRVQRVMATLPGFVAQVRAFQQHFEMSWERTALVGFSQGAIVSLEAVQREPRLAGRVLSFGGRHCTLPEQAPADTTVHFLHGMADAVIPFRHPVQSAERLRALGGDVTADVLPDVGHELHPLLIDKAMAQLRSFVPKKVWREAMIEALVAPPESNQDLSQD